MISSKWCLISVVIALLLLTVNTSAQETLGPAQLAGTYFAGHTYGGSTITLKADGTYVDDSGSCTLTTEESGTFVVANGSVRFKTILRRPSTSASSRAAIRDPSLTSGRFTFAKAMRTKT